MDRLKVFLYPTQMWMKEKFEYEFPQIEVIEIKLIPIKQEWKAKFHHAKIRKQRRP